MREHVIEIILLIIILFSLACRKPINIEECNIYLNKKLNKNEINYIRKMSIDSLSNLHFSLGLYIRNNWIYGDRSPELKKYFNNLGIYHPDDISSIIILSYWCSLNNKQLDLKNEVKKCQDYWIEEERRERENKKNAAYNQVILQKDLVDISYKNLNTISLKLPNYTTDGTIYSNEFIKYKDGYIINSFSTFPNRFSNVGILDRYHYINLKTKELFRLHINGYDTVQSIISIDSFIYIAGKANHRIKILKYINGNEIPINTFINDDFLKELNNNDWIKLGVFKNKLYALQSNGLYLFDDRCWKLIVRIDLKSYFKEKYNLNEIVIPTENIKLTENKCYFLYEVLQMRDCYLNEINIKNKTISEFWSGFTLPDYYAKEINSYFVDNNVLYVSVQKFGKIFMSEYDNNRKIYVLDNRIKADTVGQFEISVRCAIKNKSKLILIAENGLFELNDDLITPLVRFENTSQLIKFGVHYDFQPRCCEMLSDDRYLIGGMYGGLYLIDLGSGKIECLDNKEKYNTLELLK
jgi:hypothetical protein